MICGLEIIFIFTTIFSLNVELCFCTCSRNEYKIDGECCPMCAAGNCVYKHCTKDAVTTCVPCLHLTFTDTPNGLTDCLSCTSCDHGQGLRVKTPCTRSSNIVCEPLDGYYCIDHDRGSCIYAQKHTKCRPGQYIHQKGTAFKDTECAECSDGTFSNGSLEICQPHSKCEDLGLTEIKAGTHSSDAECGDKPKAALIAGIIVPVLIVGLIVTTVVLLRNKLKTNQATTGNNPMTQETALEESILNTLNTGTEQQTPRRGSKDLVREVL